MSEKEFNAIRFGFRKSANRGSDSDPCFASSYWRRYIRISTGSNVISWSIFLVLFPHWQRNDVTEVEGEARRSFADTRFAGLSEEKSLTRLGLAQCQGRDDPSEGKRLPFNSK